jgi:hypothetical protein
MKITAYLDPAVKAAGRRDWGDESQFFTEKMWVKLWPRYDRSV